MKSKFEIFMTLTIFNIILASLLAIFPISFSETTKAFTTSETGFNAFTLVNNLAGMPTFVNLILGFLILIWIYLGAYLIYDAISPARTS